jgi:hypothetical protein
MKQVLARVGCQPYVSAAMTKTVPYGRTSIKGKDNERFAWNAMSPTREKIVFS